MTINKTRMNRNILKIFIILALIFIIADCLNINSQKNIIGINPNEKGTIQIIDYGNNKYLGYIYFGNRDENISGKLWIINAYIYERYVVNQMCYGNHPAGISVYKRNKAINISNYKDQDELYLTYEHYLMGIYDNFLFLLSMGNSPTYRDFKIIDLNNNETIYEGQFLWNIGINFKEPYIVEIFEYYNESIYEIVNSSVYRKFVFDQYSFNLKTKEKINMNNRIEIIGE